MGLGKYYTMLVATMGLVGAAQIHSLLPYSLRKPDKEVRKCMLHGCTELTDHNGGFCCAAHLKRHKIITKKLLQLHIKKENGRFVFIGWRSTL